MTFFAKYSKTKSGILNPSDCPELDKILAFDLVALCYGMTKPKLKHFAYLILSYPFKLQNCGSLTLLSSIGDYGGRLDYYEIWNYVNGQVKPDSLLDLHSQKLKLCFIPKNLVKAFRAISPLKRLFNFQEFAFLFVRTVFYLNNWEILKKRKIKVESYFAFSSVQSLETLMTSYFKIQGTTTYSMQHGLYHLFENPVPMDVIAYENFCSDYHYCWGEYTKDEFSRYGIDQDKLIVGGYPRDINRPSMPLVISTKRCVVLLARRTFEHSNLALMDILLSTMPSDIEYSLKLHPTLDFEKYQDISVRNGFKIEPDGLTLAGMFKGQSYDFSIAVNTAAYYESYLYYVPSIRFTDGTFNLSIGLDKDFFGDKNSLLLLTEKLKTQNPIIYWDHVNKRLEYILGTDVNNYKIFISQ